MVYTVPAGKWFVLTDVDAISNQGYGRFSLVSFAGAGKHSVCLWSREHRHNEGHGTIYRINYHLTTGIPFKAGEKLAFVCDEKLRLLNVAITGYLVDLAKP